MATDLMALATAAVGLVGVPGAVAAAIAWFAIHTSKDAIATKVTESIKAGYANDLERLKTELKKEADAELERLKSALSQTSEVYKLALKKSEFLFQKEFDAASAFMKLTEDFNPRHSSPDMEWEDALGAIAHGFGQHEDALVRFSSSFGAILTKMERETLATLVSTASMGKHEVDRGEVSPEGRKQAESLWNGIRGLNESLLDRVRDQAQF